MTILAAAGVTFAAGVDVLIVGGGAAGLTAALAARDEGAEVLVLERDPVPQGSTALSSGFVPAAGTRAQRAHGIEDSPARFAADIAAKSKGKTDHGLVATLARAAGPAVDWLGLRHGVPFDLVHGFLYPGHSVLRMHATPARTGAELMATLAAAAGRAQAELMTSAEAVALYADPGARVAGARIRRPDGSEEAIGARAVVLASSGFGGNPELVRRYIPEMAGALFFGHAGNKGDGILWGMELGGEVRDMSGYQGHGSVASPHNILITWALMMEGGIQVNAEGRRFSNEHQGYSEQAVAVLAAPGAVAFDIYDRRLHELGLGFEDYRNAAAAGAIRHAPDLGALAGALGLPSGALAETVALTQACAAGRARDPFGRDFTAKPPLVAPFYGVKVTGALFHTQGGLAVDGQARVLRADGSALANLFAAGGAACGVSGPEAWGYLSGNGLLSAVGLGRLAGQAAARLARGGA
ncbi:MAG: FAD-dependent oxidoreductase [Pseudomonadota bacterium]